MKRRNGGDTFNVQSNYQSGGITAGQVNIGHVPPRLDDYGRDFIRRAIPAGSRVITETAHGFNPGPILFDIQRFLIDEGYDLCGSGEGHYLGPPPTGVRVSDKPDASGVYRIYVGPNL